MDWQSKLNFMVDMLGDNPSEEQQYNLFSWIVDKVPPIYWGGIAVQLSAWKHLYYDLMVRCSESGY